MNQIPSVVWHDLLEGTAWVNMHQNRQNALPAGRLLWCREAAFLMHNTLLCYRDIMYKSLKVSFQFFMSGQIAGTGCLEDVSTMLALRGRCERIRSQGRVTPHTLQCTKDWRLHFLSGTSQHQWEAGKADIIISWEGVTPLPQHMCKFCWKMFIGSIFKDFILYKGVYCNSVYNKEKLGPTWMSVEGWLKV